MAYCVVKEGNVFNWAQILTFNIFKNAQEAPVFFYMYAYLIDAICSSIHFPSLGWEWNPSFPPIHVYCSKLWDINYKKYFMIYVSTS
jgi:hypothetical protein